MCRVIVEKVSGSQIVDIDKRKYLVPSDITVAQFMWIIRKRIQLPSEKAIFLFVDKTVPQSSLTMGQLYEKEKDEDGFFDSSPALYLSPSSPLSIFPRALTTSQELTKAFWEEQHFIKTTSFQTEVVNHNNHKVYNHIELRIWVETETE
ncbi:hypothetical protein IHE44_0002555 [Lamprotornis superbus]|uniref:Gamma-aminobutyric acid receptor-associated protein-like 2 n=1 Tax=Lamprotornis superbus TaxID=245042 RepID=A0A835TSK5_9PASS|nr:hypothetical protein IHE44_0002555 [Lamprotornis superbus]